jgi:hypothetical protein
VLLSNGLIIELRVEFCARESVPVVPFIVLRMERVDKLELKMTKFPTEVLMPARVLLWA